METEEEQGVSWLPFQMMVWAGYALAPSLQASCWGSSQEEIQCVFTVSHSASSQDALQDIPVGARSFHRAWKQ